MSGFSADWLALREPVDHAARNRGLQQQVAASFSDKSSISVLDLGCGAGSNLRALAPALPPARQSWTLVDHDPALLAVARERLAAWADAHDERGDELVLEKAGKTIAVDFRREDLAANIERVLGWRPNLVTAAALFDLVSPEWIERFVAAIARDRTPLYTVLTYDGREEWRPPHARDDSIHRAFLVHQRRDKGFGPAAGPEAAPLLHSAFAHAHYQVSVADSPWILGPADAKLAAELIAGISHAAAQTGAVSPAEAARWNAYRSAAASDPAARAVVGHTDLWARP